MSGRWISRGLTVVLTAAAAGALLWFVGVLPSSRPTAGAAAVVVVLSCAVLWWTRQDLRAPVDAASWYVVRRDDAVVPPAMDYRLVRLRRDVRDAVAKAEDRPDRIYPLVLHLSENRLRDRHGLELGAEPEASAAVMTDALSAYLAKPPTVTHRSTTRELDRVVDGVEQL